MALELCMNTTGHQGRNMTLVFHSKVPPEVLEAPGPVSCANAMGNPLRAHWHVKGRLADSSLPLWTEVVQSTFRRATTQLPRGEGGEGVAERGHLRSGPSADGRQTFAPTGAGKEAKNTQIQMPIAACRQSWCNTIGSPIDTCY